MTQHYDGMTGQGWDPRPTADPLPARHWFLPGQAPGQASSQQRHEQAVEAMPARTTSWPGAGRAWGPSEQSGLSRPLTESH